jgi:hypothetical protein
LDEKLAIEEVYINGIELFFLESTIVGYWWFFHTNSLAYLNFEGNSK